HRPRRDARHGLEDGPEHHPEHGLAHHPEHGPDPGPASDEGPVETLVVDDRTILSELVATAPPGARPAFAGVRGATPWGRRLLLVGLAGVAFLATAYLWGVPMFAAALTDRVPLDWEREVGAAILEEVAPPESVCTDPERRRALEAILERLTRATPIAPYELRVTIVDDPMVNALAAPGGDIVVFQGLLEASESAEEVAGVLAHEAQHVVRRHGTRAVLEALPLQLAAAALGGDEAAGIFVGAASTLGVLRYRRRDEAEADREGLRMLAAARVAPDGMLRFFERLAEEDAEAAEALGWLSTHPASRERLEALRTLAEAEPYEAEPVLPGFEWSRMRAPCDARASEEGVVPQEGASPEGAP
ncbi:MAG TPA: M48 family metallopeptidase, partial [Longimicrobiales bacterium]|nr:M48 family metallopeptidase [Longimicrobiales bacterium]